MPAIVRAWWRGAAEAAGGMAAAGSPARAPVPGSPVSVAETAWTGSTVPQPRTGSGAAAPVPFAVASSRRAISGPVRCGWYEATRAAVPATNALATPSPLPVNWPAPPGPGPTTETPGALSSGVLAPEPCPRCGGAPPGPTAETARTPGSSAG